MRILIFGTTYVDTPEKQRVVGHWVSINRRLNQHCDLLLVDSASPMVPTTDVQVLRFPDNIGHLARGGQDGWGRAWCYGVMMAIRSAYDFVVHVESDSLFRLPVRPICEQMEKDPMHDVYSVPVRGTRTQEVDWVETGLMVIRVRWADGTNLPGRYGWERSDEKRHYPMLPEWHVRQMCGPSLRWMPWSAERGDCGQIRIDNVDNYDWITHVRPEVADAFARSILS